MDMENLFGADYEEPQNGCEAPAPKVQKGKKGSTSTSTKSKMDDETPLETRQLQVKIYSDFYMYEAPEDLEKPTIGDVRKWLVAQGFSELTKERAQFAWIKPDGETEKYLYAGVKFEKQG